MDSVVHEATYTFDYDFADEATTVERSVRREIGEIDDDRSVATLARDGATLAVRVEATDLVALRAATNTWLTLVGVAEDVAQTGETVSSPDESDGSH